MSGDNVQDFTVAAQQALTNVVRTKRWFQRTPAIEVALTDSEIYSKNELLKTNLRRRLAKFALWVTGSQILCADLVFIAYAWWGRHWDLPVAAIQAWLAATVIQVIGIVQVITRSLFPTHRVEAAQTADPLR